MPGDEDDPVTGGPSLFNMFPATPGFQQPIRKAGVAACIKEVVGNGAAEFSDIACAKAVELFPGEAGDHGEIFANRAEACRSTRRGDSRNGPRERVGERAGDVPGNGQRGPKAAQSVERTAHETAFSG